jgi:hypothetical protein
MQGTAPRNDKLDWALWLHGLGFYLFVLRPDKPGDDKIGKTPAYSGGCTTATRERAIIVEEFTRNPFANIGVSYWMSGHCIVDIDVKNDVDGLASLRALEAEHGPLPPTLTFRTASGGLHYVFHDPDGLIRNTAKRLGLGIDTRGEGGYGVGPGSVVGGKPYTVENTAPIAELPQWVADLYGKPKGDYVRPEPGEYDEEWAVEYARWEISQESGAWANVPMQGSRDNSTFNRAVRLHGLGVPEPIAAEMLREWCQRGQMPDKPIDSFIGGAYHGRPRNQFGEELPPKPATGSEVFGEAASKLPPKDATILPATRVILRRGGSYKMRDVSWLWNGYLARGKFHILAGRKGAGKSSLLFSLIAQITIGGMMPDGSIVAPGDVLIWSGEDGIEDTILPRIAAAGGDVNRVLFPTEFTAPTGQTVEFDPAVHMRELAAVAHEANNLQLIMIDSIVSASAGDSHKNAETRRGLQPAVALAEQTNAALIGVTHFAKNTAGNNPVDRVAGTLAYGALPRVVLGAVSDDENQDAPRSLIRLSSNIGPMGGGFEYTLDNKAPVPGEGFTAQRVVWGKALDGSPAQLLDKVESGGEKSAVQKAMAWLRKTLEENGPMHVSALLKRAEAYGHSRSADQPCSVRVN